MHSSKALPFLSLSLLLLLHNVDWFLNYNASESAAFFAKLRCINLVLELHKREAMPSPTLLKMKADWSKSCSSANKNQTNFVQLHLLSGRE